MATVVNFAVSWSGWLCRLRTRRHRRTRIAAEVAAMQVTNQIEAMEDRTAA
jgi:hypothetical protein